MSLAYIRPAVGSDLDAFYAFSQESGPGITSLPYNRDFLERQLVESQRAFSSLLEPYDESYLFCLEYEGEVIGSSGLVSRVGAKEPFFAYHRLIETYRSAALQTHQEVPVLYFIKARKKPTEAGTLYLKREYRGQGYAPLLSYSRFLFIALFRERFAPAVIAELRGVNHDGISPFWEAVGRHFFGFDFSEADRLRRMNPEAIRELFPRHPIYTILLPLDAQEVIGNPHPRTLPAKRLLEKQGFKQSDYLDIFDAGPHMFALTSEIAAVSRSRRAILRELRGQLESEEQAVVANTRIDFRACLSPLLIEEDRVTLPIAAGKALNVDVGEEIIYYVL
ncbi:MAG: arginine N-succinyltransferase [Chlamydiales bacterium]|nr:arginine N-succinyltransferase [Chlamydiales bacterium]